MKTYTLHSVGMLSLFKFGFIIGLLLTFLPLAMMTILIWQVVVALAAWLGGLAYQVPLPSPLPPMQLNLLEILQLQGLLAVLEGLAVLGWLRVILIILGECFTAGVLSGLAALLGGLFFNLIASLSGGLKMDLSEGSLRAPPAVPTPALPAAAPSPAPALASGPRLEIGVPVTRIAPVTLPVMLIGSDSTCQLQLPGLHPRHAQISLEEGRYILRDLSQGQSLVQGHVVQGLNLLKDGFILQVGPHRMTFRQ